MILFCNKGQSTKTHRITITMQIHTYTRAHTLTQPLAPSSILHPPSNPILTCIAFKMLILKARVSVNFQGFMLFVPLQYSSRIYINGIHFWRAHVFNQVLGFIPLFSVWFCLPIAPFYLSFSLSYELCFILQGKSDRCNLD